MTEKKRVIERDGEQVEQKLVRDPVLFRDEWLDLPPTGGAAMDMVEEG